MLSTLKLPNILFTYESILTLILSFINYFTNINVLEVSNEVHIKDYIFDFHISFVRTCFTLA